MDNFHYSLPEELIALYPSADRSQCRLLALGRHTRETRNFVFSDLVDLLHENSILVINHSKVLPARLGLRKSSGGQADILLLAALPTGDWHVLGKRLKQGMVLYSRAGDRVQVRERLGEGWRVATRRPLSEIAEEEGELPLPPYITKQRKRRGLPELRPEDGYDYQTVYAKVPGSVAAPTAGLHFTAQLLHRLQQKGIAVLRIALHVGWGTFAPMRSARLEEHRMHEEPFHIDEAAALQLTNAKREGKPIVAVGTSSVRALESAWDPDAGSFRSGSQVSSLFIRPGYTFCAVDQMITNFHLPMSSLLVMVSAFAGVDRIQAAYEEAIRLRYRFYSYGDAMWIY